MAFFKNKPTRVLIMVMVTLVLCAALVAKFYYSRVNQAVDPRVKPARELYGRYNSLAQANNYTAIFELLDSVEAVYSKYIHYQNSYETGVIWNNRAAVYLTLAVYKDSLPNMGGSEHINSLGLDSLLILSENASLKSISIYQGWNQIYQDISVEDLSDIINKDFSGISASNDKNTALKLLYDSQLKLREIDQATVILVAMKQTNSVDFGGITGMKKQVEDYANEILGNFPVTIDNIAKYFSYSLIPQTEDGSTASVCIGKIQFKDSGAESDFSQTLKTSIHNIIGSESTLSAVGSDAENCDYELSGTYQDSENEMLVSVSLLDKNNGNIVATKERTFNKNVLSLDGLRLLPANFEWIKDIPKIKLVGNGEEFTLKTDEYIDKPISFSIEMNTQSQSDLPIILSFNKDGSLAFTATVISEKDGTAQYFLNKENVPRSGEYELHALLDIATLLGLDVESDFYQDLIRDYPPQVRKIKLKVLAPTVYVKSSEFNLGNEMDIYLLAPAIKNALVELDYKFVDAEQNADYILTIDAKTRKGQKNQYMYLSYLDATIAMYKRSTSKEIYKKGLSSVKGGAADYDLAGVKAYEKAISSFLEDFLSELSSK